MTAERRAPLFIHPWNGSSSRARAMRLIAFSQEDTEGLGAQEGNKIVRDGDGVGCECRSRTPKFWSKA